LPSGLRPPGCLHDHPPAHQPDPRPHLRLGRSAREVRIAMSSVISGPVASANTADIPLHASPARRAWRRFRANRLGYVSLILFCVLFVLSLLAEVLSNDKPLLDRYEGHWYFPVLQTLPETTFGGDFPTPTDYLDPFMREQFRKPGNFALYPPNHYHYTTINYFSASPSPARPDRENWFGTDDRGRDLLARLLYGFRLSAFFALIVAGLSTLFGVLTAQSRATSRAGAISVWSASRRSGARCR